MKIRKEQAENIWMNEKQLKKCCFLLYENYGVSEEELRECKRIIASFEERANSSSGKKYIV